MMHSYLTLFPPANVMYRLKENPSKSLSCFFHNLDIDCNFLGFKILYLAMILGFLTDSFPVELLNQVNIFKLYIEYLYIHLFVHFCYKKYLFIDLHKLNPHL